MTTQFLFPLLKNKLKFTNANLTTLTSSGHMGFIENQDTCIKAIEDFDYYLINYNNSFLLGNYSHCIPP